jgi:hypothetical protein
MTVEVNASNRKSPGHVTGAFPFEPLEGFVAASPGGWVSTLGRAMQVKA